MDIKKELWDKLTAMENGNGKADTYYDILDLFSVVGQSEQLKCECGIEKEDEGASHCQQCIEDAFYNG